MRRWIVLLAVTAYALSPAQAADAPSPSPNTPLSQMIGQMIMVGFVGDTRTHPWFRDVLAQVEAGQVTGVLYLRRNIRNKIAVRAMNAALSRRAGAKLPLLIGIDQEGGRIQRLTPRVGFSSTPSAHEISRTQTPEQAQATYEGLASGLRDWGFNLNLGPVVDVDINPVNPIIGRLGRSFSAQPLTVSRYAAAFIAGHRRHGVLTALKHFPGHGSSREDSHWSMADITQSWSESELVPYRALIAQGHADLVMSAHVRHANLDPAPERRPASLSPAILTKLLRNTLGFDGVVISDDMQMRAISNNYSFADAVKRAVLAGTDILVFANDRSPDKAIPNKVIALLTEEAKTSSKMRARIESAYRRIVNLKAKLQRRVPDSGSREDAVN